MTTIKTTITVPERIDMYQRIWAVLSNCIKLPPVQQLSGHKNHLIL